ncbi:hypothetical protein AX16_004342 [Volvariella volvacea WC 439]|nr:hypothetical protein AX16_004342 [Volvariella volvacea WC 439]
MDRIATQDGIIREQELVIERLREDKSVLETGDLQTRDKERRREIRELKEQLDKQKSDRVTQLVVVGVSGGVIGFMLKACGFSLSSVWDCLRPTPPPPPTYLDLSAEELPGQVQATFAAYITQTLHLSKSI